MKRFVKCFFELLTQIIVKVRKCKVQRVCVLHFQLAGSGGCFFLMKLYHQMTKRGLDAAQISAAKRIHLNLVLVKLLELHHLGYDLRHYHAQHHAFIKKLNLPAHFQFDVAVG